MKYALALALAASAVTAATTDEIKRDCAAFKAHADLNTTETCGIDFFTLQPVHPIVQTIVPGGGTGVGLNFTLESPEGGWRRKFTTSGAISFRDYWKAESSFNLMHGAFGKHNTARDAFNTQFYVRSMSLPRMTYYGEGPQSSLANLVDFSERQTSAGASVSNPLASWIGVGGTAEGIFPDVGGVSGSTVRSIDHFYNEATAPGLIRQPPFVHTELFLHPHHAYPFEFDYHVGYNFYHDTDSGHYSFRRFKIDGKHFIYPERHGGQPNRGSVFTIHSVLSLSRASNGNQVPFYLQETLGGSNINGDPTLRGFADYRFRAPNLLLFQVQYDRRLWGPLGGLVFYDTGQVANHAGDIDIGHMRQSVGFGMSIWVGDKIVFRASLGLGSGEGRHTYFGIPAF
jgi:hypothetical protein